MSKRRTLSAVMAWRRLHASSPVSSRIGPPAFVSTSAAGVWSHFFARSQSLLGRGCQPSGTVGGANHLSSTSGLGSTAKPGRSGRPSDQVITSGE